MHETITRDDIRFWSNPHEIKYRIYLGCENGKMNGLYRLVEIDEWDEFHQIELLNNVSLENIFIVLDLMGKRDCLIDRESWEYGLVP